MKKRLIIESFFFLSALFLCLISCGIPNYYNPDGVSVNASPASNIITVTLTSDMVDSALNKYGYPQILLIYQIVPKDRYSGFNSTISSFSNAYCGYNGTRVGTSNTSDKLYSYTYSDSTDSSLNGTYGIYQFFDTSSNSIVRTLDALCIDLDSITSSSVVRYLSFSLDSETKNLILDVNDGTDTTTYTLQRFNAKAFSEDSDSLPFVGNEIPTEAIDGNATSHEIRIYAFVTTEFNDYNNIYNSTLSTNTDKFVTITL